MQNPAKIARRRKQKQEKQATIRAKYGPRGKPAPVTVRRIDEPSPAEAVAFAWLTGEPPESPVESPGKVPRATKRKFAKSLERRARKAGYESYSAYLHSPYWHGIRTAVYARDGHRCTRCSSRRGLAVHHVRYDAIGHENLAWLKTVCNGCHRRIHNL